MPKRAALLVLLSLLLALAAACGDDSSKKSSTSGPGVSDEEYLKAICTGITSFSDALVTKSNPDEIAKVVKDFSATMKQINPPADLQKFNADFVKYLDDAVNDPTALLTRKPPLPPDNVRQRLAGKESSVPECKNPTFFDASATPTPAK